MPPTGAGCHGPQGMEADEGKSRGTEAGDRVGRKPFRLRAGLSQKPGGILRLPALDSPASMSILERIDDRGPWADDGVPSDHLLFPARNLLEPYVKGLTLMVNSIFSGNCREDIWLDK